MGRRIRKVGKKCSSDTVEVLKVRSHMYVFWNSDGLCVCAFAAGANDSVMISFEPCAERPHTAWTEMLRRPVGNT